MNDLIEQLQLSDPDFARTVTRLRRVSVALAVAIAVALFAGAYAIIVNGEQSTQIKRIEKSSACETNADSYLCQHTKQESARAASTYTTCIPFKKVGYPCPRPGSGVTIKSSEHEACQCSGGGGALQPGSSGHQQPGPPSSGPPEGTEQPPEPSGPASHPEPAPEEHGPPSEPKTGPLSPVLETVCSAASHVAALC